MNFVTKAKVMPITQRMLTALFISLAAVLAFVAATPATAQAAPVSISIPVEQIFSVTPGVDDPGTFDYVLQRLNPSFPLPAGASGDTYAFSMTGNTNRDIGPITFTHAGLFDYEIMSVSPSGTGITLDDTIYVVTIAVNNTPGGGLQARIIVATRTETTPPTPKIEQPIVFEKSLSALASDPNVKVDPPVSKTVQGSPATPYTFTFRLEAMTPGAPMPEGSTGNIKDITIVGSGSREFGVWAYTTAGIFTYTVREIASSNPNYVFDTSVYTITDTVRNQDGQLVVDRVVTNAENRQVESMSFINFYVGDDVEVQGPPAGSTVGGGNRPAVGPKTGDYTDPAAMIVAMTVSAVVALFALFMIYIDRKGEDEYKEITAQVAKA